MYRTVKRDGRRGKKLALPSFRRYTGAVRYILQGSSKASGAGTSVSAPLVFSDESLYERRAVGYEIVVCWTIDARDVGEARKTRKAATEMLRSFTDSEPTLSAAELVIGELLSNAARHADGNVCLELTLADGHAQISVHDTSPEFALEIKKPTDEFSENGRGLFIISELARRVNVYPTTGVGKRVVVTLDLPVADEDLAREHFCARSWLRHEGGVCMGPRLARYRLSAISAVGE